MKGAIKIITLVIIATLITSFIAWTNKRDAISIEATKRYESCIEKQTTMTPLEFKNIFGEYPECI